MNAFGNFVAWGLAQPDSIPAPVGPRYGAGSRTEQVLTLLTGGSDKTCHEIAEAIGVTPAAIRQVIKSMLEKNLIVSCGTRGKCKTWRVT